MTSLRMRVVEAGARALAKAQYPNWSNFWEEVQEREVAIWHQKAETALDGMLDCLTENADEWVDAAGRESGFYPHSFVSDALLAVLREDR